MHEIIKDDDRNQGGMSGAAARTGDYNKKGNRKIQ